MDHMIWYIIYHRRPCQYHMCDLSNVDIRYVNGGFHGKKK